MFASMANRTRVSTARTSSPAARRGHAAAPTLVLDFDSTIVRAETMELLAEVALRGREDADEIVARVRRVTAAGMEGRLGIAESLEQRLGLFRANRSHLPAVVRRLKAAIDPSFVAQGRLLALMRDRVLVVSSGFHECIAPVVKELGLRTDRILANRLRFGADGAILGVDPSGPLARDGGKVVALREQGIDGPIVVIGDGTTDMELGALENVSMTIAYTGSTARHAAIARAGGVASTFDGALRLAGLVRGPGGQSRADVVLVESIHPAAAAAFAAAGHVVRLLPGSPDDETLARELPGALAIGVRSKTRIHDGLLAMAPELLAAGAYCVGTDHIDLGGCADRGVAIFNAPYANTRSVVELALGEIVMLLRRTIEASARLHAGQWAKTADGCHEVRGRRLGIIGYGSIGSQLSVLAEALGMDVIYHDVAERLALGNARPVESLDELLRTADVVTLHVDGRPGNRNLVGDREFRKMRDGAIFLNLSRGGVVDLKALAKHLRSGKIGGAAIDVYPEEPADGKQPFASELCGMANVILTPHVGGSTLEAQQRIAEQVSARLIDFLRDGRTVGSVNFPAVDVPPLAAGRRLVHVHHNRPGAMAGLNGVYARHRINIVGQHLNTNDRIGYAVTDVERSGGREVEGELAKAKHTIRFRVLSARGESAGLAPKRGRIR